MVHLTFRDNGETFIASVNIDHIVLVFVTEGSTLVKISNGKQTKTYAVKHTQKEVVDLIKIARRERNNGSFA